MHTESEGCLVVLAVFKTVVGSFHGPRWVRFLPSPPPAYVVRQWTSCVREAKPPRANGIVEPWRASRFDCHPTGRLSKPQRLISWKCSNREPQTRSSVISTIWHWDSDNPNVTVLPAVSENSGFPSGRSAASTINPTSLSGLQTRSLDLFAMRYTATKAALGFLIKPCESTS